MKVIIKIAILSSFMLPVLESMESQVRANLVAPYAWGLYAVQGRREKMEDDYCYENCGSTDLFGIFDGHGEGGLNASSTAAALVSYCFKNSLIADVQEKIRNALSKSEDVILNTYNENYYEPGTTALVAAIDDQQGTIGWVGDSRGLVIRNGSVFKYTVDHRPTRQEEYQRLFKLGASIVNGRLHIGINSQIAVSRALGDGHLKKQSNALIAEPEFINWQIEHDDLIVLASDGLYDVITNDEVAVFLKTLLQSDIAQLHQMMGAGRKFEHIEFEGNDSKLKLAARLLVERALNLGTGDNTSVMLIKLCHPYLDPSVVLTATQKGYSNYNVPKPSGWAQQLLESSRPQQTTFFSSIKSLIMN